MQAVDVLIVSESTVDVPAGRVLGVVDFPLQPVKALSRYRVTFLCERRFSFLSVTPYVYLAQEEEMLEAHAKCRHLRRRQSRRHSPGRRSRGLSLPNIQFHVRDVYFFCARVHKLHASFTLCVPVHQVVPSHVSLG